MRSPAILAAAFAVSVAATAWAAGPQKGVKAEDMGLRKAPVEADNLPPPKTTTLGKNPGKNRFYGRSYETAPPMIPHTVAEYLPIGLRNQCLNCHTNPSKAFKRATHVPDSHFVDRKGKAVPAAPASVRKIYGGFYNCTMCHAAQQDAKPLVGSKFEGDR